jgi:nitrite reductase/ring-hydroxylating ferredoxin subunit
MEFNNLNRRDFIKTSIKTVAVGTLALSALDIVSLVARASDKFESGSSEKIINLSDYPDLSSVGGYAIVAKRVIVIRASQSKFICLNLTCTHKHCEVDYDGESFTCPCHGSEYDKHGKVTHGPAEKNLRSYKTEYNADDNTLTISM